MRDLLIGRTALLGGRLFIYAIKQGKFLDEQLGVIFLTFHNARKS